MLIVHSLGHENPDFSSHFNNAAAVGLIRGAYHIAIFSESSGADQATYFVSNGGNWINDGKTLPGAIKVGCTLISTFQSNQFTYDLSDR